MNASAPHIILVPESIGDPFQGGFYGGCIQSGVKKLAVVWAPKALGETKGVWLPTYTGVPGAASCFHSFDNTNAMLEAGSPLAKWARDLRIGGFDDWCIPCRDVLEMGYRYLKPTVRKNLVSFRDGDNASSLPVGYPYTRDLPTQTTAKAFQDGGPEAFEEAWYWASTQYSDDGAWTQYFYGGNQISLGKKYQGRCRAVRLIQLSA